MTWMDDNALCKNHYPFIAEFGLGYFIAAITAKV